MELRIVIEVDDFSDGMPEAARQALLSSSLPVPLLFGVNDPFGGVTEIVLDGDTPHVTTRVALQDLAGAPILAPIFVLEEGAPVTKQQLAMFVFDTMAAIEAFFEEAGEA